MTTQEQGTIGFEELKADALSKIVGAASPEEQAVAVAAYNKIILDEAEAGVKAEKSRRADARASQAANSTVIEEEKAQLATAISNLVGASKLSGLGVNVSSLRWFASHVTEEKVEEEDGSTTVKWATYPDEVRFPKGEVAAPTMSQNGARPKYTYRVDGVDYSARQLADKFANEEQRKTSNFKTYPTAKSIAGKIMETLKTDGHEAEVVTG